MVNTEKRIFTIFPLRQTFTNDSILLFHFPRNLYVVVTWTQIVNSLALLTQRVYRTNNTPSKVRSQPKILKVTKKGRMNLNFTLKAKLLNIFGYPLRW